MKRKLQNLMLIALMLVPVGTMAKDLYCYYTNSNKTLTFYYDDELANRKRQLSTYPNDRIYDIAGTNGWNAVRSKVEQIKFDNSFWDARIAGLGGFFRDCTNLQKVINFGNFNGDKCTDWSYLFYNCLSLKSIDLSDFRSGPAANWSHMFDGCMALTAVTGLQNVATSSATDMSYMFNNCINLASLDLSNFNTAKVTNMSHMFANCQSLTSLDLSSFNTANVTDMSYMLNSCEQLRRLDLSNFNTAKVTSMTAMFSGCSKVTEINVTSFDMSRVKSLTFMFSSCPQLVTIYCNCDWKDYLPSDASCNYIFDNDTKLMGGHSSTYKDSWGIDEAHPDIVARPGAFTPNDGLIFNGHLLTAANAQSFAKNGSVDYDPENFTLTMNNATFVGEGGFWFPPAATLNLYLIGQNSITTSSTAIEGGDVFPAATTDGASLSIKSTDGFGLLMWGNSVLSGDEITSGKILELNIEGRLGAICGNEMWNSYSNRYQRPRLILGDMVLTVSSSNNSEVIGGLEKIDETNIRYSYDNYYYNDEKRAVYDCGVRPNGDGEGVVVTKPFKIVPKDKLVQYDVNLGGNWLNNYNADDFNPMSLSSGKVTYSNNVMKLKDAKFNTAYIPYDELYALYVEGNGFLLSLEGDNNLVGTDDDYPYGLRFEEDEKVDGLRQWIINGIDDEASLSLMGDMYCQSLGDENQALLTIVDSKITVPDGAYFWQEDNVDLFIRNSELDLRCAKWPDQNIMESFCSVTLQDCQFADGCYWDAQKGVVVDSSGQPAKGRVRILRGSSGVKKGDVTGEGDVNSADVVAIYRYIIEGEASGFTKTKADVDGNGEVNSADVVAVYKIIISGN